MRRFSPAMNVDHVPSCHLLFCEHYVASLYLNTPVGKLLDRVFPPINCFFRVTRREAKSAVHRSQPARMGKNCIESTVLIRRIIPCGYIRYVCYRSNQLAVRMQIARAYRLSPFPSIRFFRPAYRAYGKASFRFALLYPPLYSDSSSRAMMHRAHPNHP